MLTTDSHPAKPSQTLSRAVDLRRAPGRKRPVSLDAVTNAVDELQKRVRREIERCEAPRSAQGTALTGGWAKVGNRTQDLLCATIEWIAESEGLDPLEALRKESKEERTLAEASFFTLGKVLRAFAKLPASAASPVHRITHDVASRQSAINQIVKKRRDKVHEREQEAQLSADLRSLKLLEGLLRKVKDDLHTEE